METCSGSIAPMAWRGTTANPLGNLGSERQSYPLLIGSTLRVSTE